MRKGEGRGIKSNGWGCSEASPVRAGAGLRAQLARIGRIIVALETERAQRLRGPRGCGQQRRAREQQGGAAALRRHGGCCGAAAPGVTG